MKKINFKTILIIAVICYLIILAITHVFLWTNNTAISGQIGDTINGLSAPILSLISAWLIYLALTKQIESNDDNRDGINFKIIYSAINALEDSLKNFKFEDKNGAEAIALFFANCTIELRKSSLNNNLQNNIEQLKLPLLNFGRIFFLKDKLIISSVYQNIINAELIHFYNYYLQNPLSLTGEWGNNIEFKNRLTEVHNELHNLKISFDSIGEKVYNLTV